MSLGDDFDLVTEIIMDPSWAKECILQAEDKANFYEQTLKEIERFGHNEGHGKGYTCANMAEAALKKVNENE